MPLDDLPPLNEATSLPLRIGILGTESVLLVGDLPSTGRMRRARECRGCDWLSSRASSACIVSCVLAAADQFAGLGGQVHGKDLGPAESPVSG